MMFKLEIILLVISAFYNYNVSGRTCVCAQFIESICDEQENCQWNERATIGSIKGNHGICRSNKWMDCHLRQDCILPGNAPQNATNDTNTNDKLRRLQGNGGNNGGNGGHNGQNGDNGTDIDWPWDCLVGKYHKQVINVRAYQLLAKQSISDIVDNAKPSSVSTKHALSMMIKAIGMIVFGVLLIGVAIRWKIKNYGKQSELIQPLDAGVSYSTF